MTPEETAIVLDFMATAWRYVPPPEELPLWAHQFRGVDAEVAMDAAENLVGTSVYMPKIAEMQMEIAAVLRARAKADELAVTLGGGPDSDCPICHGKVWYDGDPGVLAVAGTGEIEHHYDTVRPCQFCGPEQHARWREYQVERTARTRIRLGDQDDVAPVKSAIQQARDRLAANPPKETP